MEIVQYENPEAELEADKQTLWKIMLLSGGIDIFTSYGIFASMGVGVVVEELVESGVSQIIAKYGKVKLSAFDNIMGVIPVPGVTAVTVHCARKLLAIKLKQKLSR